MRWDMRIVLFFCLFAATAQAQQANPFGAGGLSSARPSPADSLNTERPVSARVDKRVETMDSVVYRLASSSLLQVKTGKAGLLGFAGHTHVIQAQGFSGEVVYYPGRPSRSRLDIVVPTESLEVLTPRDTAEIRKVTESMRTQV